MIRVVWSSEYVRLVALPLDPSLVTQNDRNRNPLLMGGEDVRVEVEIGRDLTGTKRWTEISLWGDDGITRGQYRSIVAPIAAALLAAHGMQP